MGESYCNKWLLDKLYFGIADKVKIQTYKPPLITNRYVIVAYRLAAAIAMIVIFTPHQWKNVPFMLTWHAMVGIFLTMLFGLFMHPSQTF